jgi:hypothetical protein
MIERQFFPFRVDNALVLKLECFQLILFAHFLKLSITNLSGFIVPNLSIKSLNNAFDLVPKKLSLDQKI